MRGLQYMPPCNKTNSENGHLGFSIFKKTTESVIFRLYFKDIVKPMNHWFEISPTPLFSYFS